MNTQTAERRQLNSEGHSDTTELELFFAGLTVAAEAIRQHPRQRRLLEIYADPERPDAIHDLTDAPISDSRANIVFWHNHGSFVAPDGAIYRVRMDDEGAAQVYASPLDERARSVDCIRPVTYDSQIGPHGIEMRIDFINGVHRELPKNTSEQRMLQHREGRDVMLPRHNEDMRFIADRDSIFLRKQPDGSTDAWLHDSVHGDVVRMYGAAEVLAMAAVQDERSSTSSADYRLTA